MNDLPEPKVVVHPPKIPAYNLDMLLQEKKQLEDGRRDLESTYQAALKRNEERMAETERCIAQCYEILKAHKDAGTVQ